MKYKVGDKVRVKSLEWYNKNRNEYGVIKAGGDCFVSDMSAWCDQVVEIREVFLDSKKYKIKEDSDYCWTDSMFEGLAEEAKPEQPQIFDFYGMSLLEEKLVTTNLDTTWKITRVPGGVIMRESLSPSVFVPMLDKKG